MNNVVGPLIVLALGLILGIVFHNLWRFWIGSAFAVLAATILWVGGSYVLFVLTAPGELGSPALRPILLTIATAFAGALVAGGVVRAVRTP
jgi:hypothetical protein